MNPIHAHKDKLSPNGLIACPTCDALHKETDVPISMAAKCVRCGHTLLRPRKSAMTQILMLAATAFVLMCAGIFFPFLELQAGGRITRSSVFDAVLAFSDGVMLPVAILLGALIIVVPLVRFMALIYVFAPMSLGHYPARYAPQAFRLAERLSPWSMAEIFIVGVGVALIKVTGLATVLIGPAFWAFCGLVVVTVLKDTFMCKLTVWKTLENRRLS